MSHTLKDALRDRRSSVVKAAMKHIRGRQTEADQLCFVGPDGIADAILAWNHLSRAASRVLRENR